MLQLIKSDPSSQHRQSTKVAYTPYLAGHAISSKYMSLPPASSIILAPGRTGLDLFFPYMPCKPPYERLQFVDTEKLANVLHGSVQP